jgi:tyrosyl-DNA phosphodiesterase-1
MLTWSRQHFDSDVRDMVKVKIIHGFWKRDDGNRIALLVSILSPYV